MNTTTSSKLTGSAHISSPAESDIFDPNSGELLNQSLRRELLTCYKTEGRLDTFPDYVHVRPERDDAMTHLLSALEMIAQAPKYEEDAVDLLNAYIDQTWLFSECSFRFVYLDRRLVKQNLLSLDIAIVYKACLDEQLQKTRRELAKPGASKSEETVPLLSTKTEPPAAPIIFYSDVVVAVEMTFEGKSMHEEMLQAASYVREVRFAQPFRHFVPCLFLNRNPPGAEKKEWHFRIVHFDPAGYWHSGSHVSCSANQLDFSSALRYLTSRPVGYPDCMLNPPCLTSVEKRHPETILIGKTRQVKLIEILSVRNNLMGPCTFAYLAEDSKKAQFTVKESWSSSNRTTELEFLKIATQRKVPNMALLHPDFEDLVTSAFIVTTTNAIRHIGDSTTPGNRRAIRISLDRQGFPIERAEDPWLIVAVMYCAISAIRGLSNPDCPFPAINHCDISLSNILLSDRNWKNKPLSKVAFLIDLDNAAYYKAGNDKANAEDDSKEGHLHRTGTLLYMSSEALSMPEGFRHLPRHDFESVYYVGIILACLQKDGTIPEALHSLWTTGSLLSIGNLKEKSILGRKSILQFMEPRHQVLKDHLKKTFQSLREYSEDEKGYDKTAEEQHSEDLTVLVRGLKELESLAEDIRREESERPEGAK